MVVPACLCASSENTSKSARPLQCQDEPLRVVATYFEKRSTSPALLLAGCITLVSNGRCAICNAELQTTICMFVASARDCSRTELYPSGSPRISVGRFQRFRDPTVGDACAALEHPRTGRCSAHKKCALSLRLSISYREDKLMSVILSCLKRA